MRCVWAARCVVVAKDQALLGDSVALWGRALHATRDEPLPIARRIIGSFLVYSSQSADCEQAFGYAEECKKHIHDQRDSQLIEQHLLVAMNRPSVTDAQSSGIIDRAQNSFAHEASRNDRARPGEFYQRGRSMVQRKRVEARCRKEGGQEIRHEETLQPTQECTHNPRTRKVPRRRTDGPNRATGPRLCCRLAAARHFARALAAQEAAASLVCIVS